MSNYQVKSHEDGGFFTYLAIFAFGAVAAMLALGGVIWLACWALKAALGL